MSDIILKTEEIEEKKHENRDLIKKTDNILHEAKGFIIKTGEQFHLANDILITIKSLQKEVNQYFDPVIKKVHEAHKSILDAKKKQSEPLKQAEKIIKSKVLKYHEEQERIRREEELKRQEMLRKQEEERLLEVAIENDDETILDETIPTPKIEVEDTTRHEGISYSLIWRFRIVDKAKVPDEYKIIDESKIRRIVQTMKEDTKIAGIEVYQDKIVKAR